MNLDSFIAIARSAGASDLHLEPGLPPGLRVRGQLQVVGEPLSAQLLLTAARSLIGDEHWTDFLERRSFDCSRRIQGVRCRINVLQSARGVGFAIRLLTSFDATLDKLNLHPSLRDLVRPHSGLILVSGPTGSGKSSTLAALLQEINLAEPRHILTLESPIEYVFRPKLSLIRQREVGRDTPSFEQGLLDALREDPDVLMVGEMRDPETMRLTLSAAETGHLVLATVHSSSCIEAVQRVVGAFPSEIQNSIGAQLADCLVGVVCQRLRFRDDLKIRVPECEVLMPTNPVKAHIRSREFFKISSVLETGGDAGMWTFLRYQNWLTKKKDWHVPDDKSAAPEDPPAEAGAQLPPLKKAKPAPSSPGADPKTTPGSGRIEIEPVDGGLDGLLRGLK
ncbi:MAG TPA: type IV pili twitching motility protein PilT [Verrucomicrobiales bacterium]|nr:type IV pili twitching motility protein PilT [Verrucomicrobiales bacterium]